MKKNILLVASGSFLALHGVSAAAQDAPPAEVETAAPASDDSATKDASSPALDEVASEIDAMGAEDGPRNDAVIVAAEASTDASLDHDKMDHASKGEEIKPAADDAEADPDDDN